MPKLVRKKISDKPEKIVTKKPGDPTSTKSIPARKPAKKKSSKKRVKKTGTRKIVAPKKSTKRIVKKAPAKKKSKPKRIVKKPVKQEKPETEEAKIPVETSVAGWRKKLKKGKDTKKARVMRPKSELWDKRREEIVKRAESGEKIETGFVIHLKGLRKVGKSHFAQSAVEFEGFEGEKFRLGPGAPVYIIDTESAAEIIAGTKFAEQMQAGLIIPFNAVVKRGNKIFYTESFDLVEELVFSLVEEKSGTLVIDNWTDVVDWAFHKLVEHLGYGFKSDGITPKREVTPMQRRWMNKKLNNILRYLREIGMNVLLLAPLKPEYRSTGPGPYDFEKTGGFEPMYSAKGEDFWFDLIVTYEKIKNEDGTVTRRLYIEDSRFETVDMKGREYIIEKDPTFTDFINLFSDML